jgi:polar amino acid transport system substrate-binding protein
MTGNYPKWWTPLFFFGLLIFSLVCYVVHPGITSAESANDIASSVSVSSITRIQSTRTLRIGVNPLFWPFSYVDRNGKRVGIDLDIANLLAANMNVSLKVIVPNNFNELIPMLQQGDIDLIIAAMSRTFKRAQVVDFSIPYFTTGVTILINRKMGYELGISNTKSFAELTHILEFLEKEDQLRIIATEGKAPAESVPEFFPKANIVKYPTNETAIEALYQGEGHIMVHDKIFLKSWFERNRSRALYKLVLFEKPYKLDNYGFAVAKNNIDFLNILNIFIEDKLFNEGYLERFISKHQY